MRYVSTKGTRWPQFFIIGGPKCGTSALYQYLAGHPQIFLPELKEPDFFCTDFPGLGLNDLDEYLDLFSDAPVDKLLGEASVWYLMSEAAIDNIMETISQPKFIAMLRNPVDMAQSLHSTLLTTFQEDVTDFRSAWELQDERRQGRKLPYYCPEPTQLQYRLACSLGRQLERVLKRVPRAQLKVIVFDDFATDTQGVYESVLEFLGLPSDQRTQFEPVNQRVTYGSNPLVDLLRRPPRSLAPLLLGGKNLLNACGIRPSIHLKRHVAKPQRSPTLHGGFRAQLVREFADEVERLEALLERDLSHWKS